MHLGKFTKAAADEKRYVVDYTDWLDTDETVSTVTFLLSPATNPALVVYDSSILTGAKKIQFFVSDGNTGDTYTVLVTITTSGDQTKQDSILFKVVPA